MEDDVIHSGPLKSLVIEIGKEYLSFCLDWLLDRGCVVSPQGDIYYKVVYPVGTREEIRRSLAGHWTRRRAIIFPDGEEAQHIEAIPPDNPTVVYVTIGFPAKISRNLSRILSSLSSLYLKIATPIKGRNTLGTIIVPSAC